MIGRNPISRFAALAMGGIVVLTLAWTLAAGWLAVPVSGMSKWVLENAANGWVQRVDLTFDVEQAICHVLARCSPEQARALEGVVRGTSAGRKEHRRQVTEMLRQELADYGNSSS